MMRLADDYCLEA